MSNNNSSNANPYSLIPELGDYVTIISDVYRSTTGRIIYRDLGLIRIRPFTSSNTAVDFPLDEQGQFIETLGVTEVQIHEKRKYPHYSKQLSTVPGEILEFYNTDGTTGPVQKTVFEIIATDQYDAIKLDDGTVLDFGFIGPAAPYFVIRPVAAKETEELGLELEPEPEVNFPEIDISLLPAALVEEIPSEERTYSDTEQREDMFVSLLLNIPQKRQKDAKVMKAIYRETDVLLALKNSVVERDESGAVNPESEGRSYRCVTIQEALEKQPTGAPISALIPVAAVKKALYISDIQDESDRHNVVIRNENRNLFDSVSAGRVFASQTAINPFFAYIQNYLKSFEAYTAAGSGTKRIRIDQDVLRSEIPPTKVEGFINLANTVDRRKGAADDLTSDYIGSIDDRLIRLVGPARMRKGIRTDTQMDDERYNSVVVASGDSAETIGHILLSKELASFRSPVRSSVLLWDVHASEASRIRVRLFYKTLTAQWEDQLVITDDVAVDLSPLVSERLTNSLAIITPENVSVLDSLGLRNLELTDSVFDIVKTKNTSSQAIWDSTFKALQRRALKSLEEEAKPVFPTVASAESRLFSEDVLGNELFRVPMTFIKEKETLLLESDLVLANDILKYAELTYGQFWYALTSGDPVIIAEREAIFNSEQERQNRNIRTKRQYVKEFTARPDINPCIHVQEYEKVKGIRNDEERMLIFDTFVKKYQAGQNGNNILCGTCGKDLVCKHEILLLQEFLHPGRGVALHKTLLLEYSGPVFEGAYICKNCGQKIAELEYDTHMEFDDEGRPLVGRSVIKDTGDDETDFAVALREEGGDKIPFEGVDLAIYFVARTLFERAGIVANISMYKRVIMSAQEYLKDSKRVFERGVYDPRRTAAIKAAKPGAPVPPTYDSYFATSQIGILGALLVLELQTSDLEVTFAASGCQFSRDGFPLAGDAPAVAGTGALKYVACVVSSILRNDTPWNKTVWSPETQIKRRSDMCEQTVLNALNSVLCIKVGAVAPVPLSTITSMYRDKLEAARTSRMIAGADGDEQRLLSNADRVPPSFRPFARIRAIAANEETPIGNKEQFIKQLSSSDILQLAPLVNNRIQQVAQKVIVAMNTSAKETGFIPEKTVRSDSACCFSKLSVLAVAGFGVGGLSDIGLLEETNLLGAADMIISRRDPAASECGTHVFVPWSAPHTEIILPEADPTVYYKLFIKHCFVNGRNYGGVHELGDNYTCRNCKFAYPKELTYLTANDIPNDSRRGKAMDELADKRKDVSLAALAAQGVDVNESTFRNLEEAIRMLKTVPIVPPVIQTPFMELLLELATPLNTLLPSASADWRVLVTAVTKIQSEGIKSGVQRRREFGDFSRRYDMLIPALETIFKKYYGTTPSAIAAIARIIAALKTTTANPEYAVGNLQTVFVTPAEQIAHEFTNADVNAHKWFPTLSRHHEEDLKKIWKKTNIITTTGIEALKELSEGAKNIVQIALTRFTAWLGPSLKIWRTGLRAGNNFTLEEYILVLQWTIHSGCLSLLTDSSPLYAGADSPAEKAEAVGYIAKWIGDALGAASENIKRYQLSVVQIAEALHARAELEKAFFIKKFDDLDKDLRKIELIKKSLKIGDWAVGTVKNLFSYDADFYEIQRDQRAAMGLPEFGAGDTPQVSAADRYGFFSSGGSSGGEGTEHRAPQDEDY